MSLIKKLLQLSQKSEMQKLVHGATDVGRLRSGNEDFFTIDNDKNLFIVADGMGGHNAGDVASSNAVKMTDEFLTKEKLGEVRGDIRKTRETIIQSILYAHENILKMAGADPRYEGMGCTIVAALIFGNNLHLCHVGDARAYISNENGMTLLTRDHSYVMDLVINGKLSIEEARVSPLKNKLHQAVGALTAIKPDYKHCFLKEGDKILLCSDGLWDMLSDDQMHTVLKQDKPVKKLCELLITMANDAGGHDNITALVIQHKEKFEEGPDPTEEELEILKSTGEYSFVFTNPVEEETE
ncbi:MAG: Stp1/IreP family PP2C-type Ser/Thr phosphatase [Candidatus Omnitrophota bacterium]